MSSIEKTLKSELIFNGRIIKVLVDDIIIEDTKLLSKREVVVHRGGVCALVRTKDDKIKFVRQFRYSFKENILELPAGKLEEGEEPDRAIVRELEEEVGVIPNTIEKMGFVYSSPGFCTEKIYLYYVDDYQTTATHFDIDESLDLFEYTYDEVFSLVQSGKISDAKTLSLLYRCHKKFENIK